MSKRARPDEPAYDEEEREAFNAPLEKIAHTIIPDFDYLTRDMQRLIIGEMVKQEAEPLTSLGTSSPEMREMVLDVIGIQFTQLVANVTKRFEDNAFRYVIDLHRMAAEISAFREAVSLSPLAIVAFFWPDPPPLTADQRDSLHADPNIDLGRYYLGNNTEFLERLDLEGEEDMSYCHYYLFLLHRVRDTTAFLKHWMKVEPRDAFILGALVNKAPLGNALLEYMATKWTPDSLILSTVEHDNIVSYLRAFLFSRKDENYDALIRKERNWPGEKFSSFSMLIPDIQTFSRLILSQHPRVGLLRGIRELQTPAEQAFFTRLAQLGHREGYISMEQRSWSDFFDFSDLKQPTDYAALIELWNHLTPVYPNLFNSELERLLITGVQIQNGNDLRSIVANDIPWVTISRRLRLLNSSRLNNLWLLVHDLSENRLMVDADWDALWSLTSIEDGSLVFPVVDADKNYTFMTGLVEHHFSRLLPILKSIIRTNLISESARHNILYPSDVKTIFKVCMSYEDLPANIQELTLLKWTEFCNSDKQKQLPELFLAYIQKNFTNREDSAIGNQFLYTRSVMQVFTLLDQVRPNMPSALTAMRSAVVYPCDFPDLVRNWFVPAVIHEGTQHPPADFKIFWSDQLLLLPDLECQFYATLFLLNVMHSHNNDPQRQYTIPGTEEDVLTGWTSILTHSSRKYSEKVRWTFLNKSLFLVAYLFENIIEDKAMLLIPGMLKLIAPETLTVPFEAWVARHGFLDLDPANRLASRTYAFWGFYEALRKALYPHWLESHEVKIRSLPH